ncbi:MAG: mechanosensitive ion channel family protein [Bacilli bacterium]|nr:mechanosensitive ion channel family protein [Bacilli bacterium]MBN2877483.1 mechanosensitive ion channel family protein [Bacilli bacterium]
MKFDFKHKTKEEKIRVIVVVVVIFLCLALGTLAPIIFPGTQFAQIIESSIGKFFNLVDFFTNNYVTILESLAVLVFIWILYKILLFIVSIFVKRGHRSETIGNLIMSALKYFAVIAALFLILSAWNVQTPTLLAGAGIIGLAISFGAQSLIEDIFAGLFIIFEKQFAVGDVIQIGDFRGIVKEMGLRITKFEDINGDIKMLNNSDIRGAINSSNVLSQAICEIGISYNQDIEKFEAFMRENLKGMKEQISTIRKGPFYDGIEVFGDSGITIRVVAWVKETDRLYTVREMNKHLKILFDKNHIEIPYPQLVIHKTDTEAK